MHEMSLVRSLLQQVGDIAVAQGGIAVEQIRVEMGPLAGVEPLLVHSAFEQLVAESPAAGSQLLIDEVSLELLCRECGREFVLEEFRFECPECRSRDVRVIRGEEFRLISITIRELADRSETPVEVAR